MDFEVNLMLAFWISLIYQKLKLTLQIYTALIFQISIFM